MQAQRLTRRRFGHLLALGGAVAAASPVTACAAARAPETSRRETSPRVRPALLKPRHLAAGNTVGLVLPASLAFEASTIDLARAQLEALGFRVKVGAHARQNLRPFSREGLRRVVMSSEPIGTLANPEKEDDELVNRAYRIVTLTPGQCRGRLVGGNLTLVAALMGTPWEVDTEGAILLLEDVEEELYRVDRMLTQLAQGGKLAKAAGVVFGYCTDSRSARGRASAWRRSSPNTWAGSACRQWPGSPSGTARRC